ncbi:hypothetical protein [Plantactinospora sonchi]|uniref:Type VII secretion protein EccE n=1 Tax=Plantactinospora sonchi TaxID=1544735 RepID=A0ABU7RNX2_9ACTN
MSAWRGRAVEPADPESTAPAPPPPVRTIVAAARLDGPPAAHLAALVRADRPAAVTPPTGATPQPDVAPPTGAATRPDAPPPPAVTHPAVAEPGPARSTANVASPARLPWLHSAPPVLRIICWQVVLVLAILAVGRRWPVAVALGGTAAVGLLLSATRVRGTWLSTVLARRLRLLLRRRAYRLPIGGDGSSRLLALLAPGARVRPADLGGEAAAVVSRPDAMVAVLRPVNVDAVQLCRTAMSGALSPDGDEPDPRPETHLVLHRGAGQAPARGWLTVRVRRGVDIAGDEVLRLVLANAVRRLLRRTRRRHLELAALPGPDVLAVLTALTHTGPGRGDLREEWRYWWAGPVCQVTLRLSGESTAADDAADQLTRLLAEVPEVAVTVAVAAHPGNLAGALRIAATTPETTDTAADRLTALGPRLGVRLERLDGRHGRAVAATLPIGGNLG